LKKIGSIQKRYVLVFCLISALISAFGTYTLASSPSATFTISSGQYPGAPSYTVYQVAGVTYAKDQNGLIEFNGANAATVINSAINGLPLNSLGGKQGEIAFADATYNITSTITVPAYSKIVFTGNSPIDAYSLQWDTLAVTGGTLFQWTGSTGGPIVSVPANGGTYSEPSDMCSWVSFTNFAFRYTDRSHVGIGLDLSGAYGFELHNIVVDVAWNPISNAPVASSIGIYVPHAVNERRIMDNVVVFGYDTGYYIQSDHLSGTEISAYFCTRGVEFASCGYVTLNYIHTLYCKYHIVISGTTPNLISIQAIEFEDTSDIPWITTAFYGFYNDGSGSISLKGSVGVLGEAIDDTRRAIYHRYNALGSAFDFDIGFIHTVQGTDDGAEIAYNNLLRGMRDNSLGETFRFFNGASVLQVGSGGLIIRDSSGRDFKIENGNIEVGTAGGGIILKAANGSQYLVTVTNAGALNVAPYP
jgi:hypothetical protein